MLPVGSADIQLLSVGSADIQLLPRLGGRIQRGGGRRSDSDLRFWQKLKKNTVPDRH
ncbi:MAG: hypothetical protein IJO98_06395 [Clostridia bacterium]|nr:hypothetical protein [Clostridia bacterium]